MSRQRGFSMLETAIVVLLVGSAIAVAFLVLRIREPVQVQAQERALQWADQALLAFAARNARLPCAVATPTSGLGECVPAGQKGWLPVRALEAVHPGGDGPAKPLRYMVYRGDSKSDLVVGANHFSAHKWDGEAHDFTAINGLDLCEALASAAKAGVRADRARTMDIDGNVVNVAYGLSAAGPTPGESGLHDGLNVQATAQMEPPGRGVDSGYDDRVRVRDFQSLSRSLGCDYGAASDPRLVLVSVDQLALSVDVSDEVDEQHQGNMDDTDLAVSMAAVSEVLAVINVALAAANISNSVSTLATASAQLSGAIASCAVLVGCAFIPIYTAAVTAAGVAIGLSSVATGLAAVALGLTTAALAETIIARDLAHTPIPRGPTNIADLIYQTCMAAEGGYATQTADADGNLIPLVPPQWKDGLKQEVGKIAQEIVETQAEIAAAAKTLKSIRDFQLPWGGLLINEDYNKPTQGDKESNEDYKKRYDAWKAGQPAYIVAWEEQLANKLAAIEKAEDARVVYALAKQAKKDTASQLSRMNSAIASLSTNAMTCLATPAQTPADTLRCDNMVNSLAGLMDCNSPYTSVVEKDGYVVRQCLPELQKAYDDAVKKESSTYSTFYNLQFTAYFLPDPPLFDYIHHSGCGIWWNCNILINPMQDFEHDDRETYAGTYYKKLELENLLVLKQAELEEKKAAYDKAQAQCDALRAMNTETGNGQTLPPVWSGAAAVLEAADCRGATGSVDPLSCAATP